MSDEQLVTLSQRGDTGAFNQLADRWRHEIYRFFCRSVGSIEDARDLSQETFVRAYLGIGKLRQGAQFRTWLYRIATNLAHDRFRRAARIDHKTEPLESDEIPVERPAFRAPDDAALWGDVVEALRDALGVLPEDQRTAILMREYQGLTTEEIGTITGAPAGTVRTRIFYGLRAMRRHMEARGVAFPDEVM